MQKKQVQVHACKERYNGLANQITSKCGIHSALSGPIKTSRESPLVVKHYQAIWDTGATNTSITIKVADECGLPLIGTTKVHHANGVDTVDVFLASLYLPNRIAFPIIRVNEAKLTGADILIGMDIIGKGDFAISNYNGTTQFSFRMPSLMHIDLSNLDQGGKSGRKSRRRR